MDWDPWSVPKLVLGSLMDKQHKQQQAAEADGQAAQATSSGFDGQATRSSRSSGSATPLYRWQVLCGKKQVAPPADKKDGLTTLTLVSESWWLP